MISYMRRWTGAAICSAALLAAAFVAPLAYAASDDDLPVDAVPIMRPGSVPQQGLPTATDPLPEPPAVDAPGPQQAAPADEPKIGAVALPAPESAVERIPFEPDEVTLSGPVQQRLKEFADRLKAQAGRVAIKSYAGELGDTSMNARRTSLKRALAVREFLLAQGLDAERFDVQALGGARDTGALDRVDIVQQGRQTTGKKTKAAD